MIAQARKLFTLLTRGLDRAGLALVFLLVVGLNLSTARVWFCQIRSASFPTTEGIVLSHKKVKSDKSTKLVIEYEYEANGVHWISNRHWYEGLYTYAPSYLTDKAIAARFPQGARVPVSFNPANPADAVLVPGLQGADVFAAWLTVLFTVFVSASHFSARNLTGAERFTYRWLPRRFGWQLVVTSNSGGPQFWAPPLLLTALLCFFVLHSDTLLSVSQSFGAIAVTVAAAWLWMRLDRTKVWLDVDPTKRQLRWHSGELFAGTFKLPFEAVTDIQTETREYSGQVTFRVQLEWYTTKHRTLTLALPACSDRALIDAAVARLREAVFGATAPAQLGAPDGA